MFKDKLKVAIISILLFLFVCYSIRLYTDRHYSNTHSVSSDRGKLLWQDYNCSACHQIYGLGGYLGPDLTNVYSKIGAETIKVFLQNGTVTMPDFQLSDQETKDLIAFMKEIDSSGKSDPRLYTIHTNGTIEQEKK